MKRHNRPAPRATVGLVVVACILPVLLAGDDTPRLPAKDLHGSPACVVVRVVSGDTVIVRVAQEGRRLALLGVKAPPLSQPFGHDARRYLESLLKGEQVYVEFPTKANRTDSFGRTPAMLYRVPDGLCINLEVIRQGWADVAGGLADDHVAAFEFFAKRAKESAKGRWAPSSGNAAATNTAGGNADMSAAENGPSPDDGSDPAGPDAPVPTTAPTADGSSANSPPQKSLDSPN